MPRAASPSRHRSPRATGRARALLALFVAAIALPAGAGEPLVTEDASILPKGACQLESWYRRERGRDVLWALPACSPGDQVEFAAGAAAYRDDTGSHGVFLVQAKPMLYRDPDGRWAAAAVLVAARDTARPSGRTGFQDAAALGVATVNFIDETLRVHVNAGVVHSHDEFTTGAWGLAAEYDLSGSWTLLGEAYRDSPGRPHFQLGVRRTIIADRLEVFASAGDQLHGTSDTRFLKIGMRLQADVFR
jgi:hypothetical protein